MGIARWSIITQMDPMEVTGIVAKNFPPPKRAGELKYWWKAIRKVIPAMPEWQDSFAQFAELSVDSIIMQKPPCIGPQGFAIPGWLLIVARKEYMKG